MILILTLLMSGPLASSQMYSGETAPWWARYAGGSRSEGSPPATRPSVIRPVPLQVPTARSHHLVNVLQCPSEQGPGAVGI